MGDEDEEESPKAPASVKNATPALGKMGFPGTDDYASGPRGKRPTDNGGRVQRTPAETDDAWRKYTGVDPKEYDDRSGLAGGDIAKDKESRTNRMSKEQGLLNSYTNMSAAQRGSEAGKLTRGNYMREFMGNPNTKQDMTKDLPVASAKRKMKAAPKKG